MKPPKLLTITALKIKRKLPYKSETIVRYYGNAGNNENLTFLDCTSNMSMKEVYIRMSHKMVSAKTDDHCTITYKP